MSWDIYGQPLKRGYCEVHPHVQQEYPCDICAMESDRYYRQKEDQRQYEREMKNEYEETMRRDYEVSLFTTA